MKYLIFLGFTSVDKQNQIFADCVKYLTDHHLTAKSCQFLKIAHILIIISVDNITIIHLKNFSVAIKFWQKNILMLKKLKYVKSTPYCVLKIADASDVEKYHPNKIMQVTYAKANETKQQVWWISILRRFIRFKNLLV